MYRLILNRRIKYIRGGGCQYTPPYLTEYYVEIDTYFLFVLKMDNWRLNHKQ
jgi:hypothetical protein